MHALEGVVDQAATVEPLFWCGPSPAVGRPKGTHGPLNHCLGRLGLLMRRGMCRVRLEIDSIGRCGFSADAQKQRPAQKNGSE